MDNRLVITNADVSNTGRYTCKSFTEDNTMYSAEYELNVEGEFISHYQASTSLMISLCCAPLQMLL